MKNALLLMNMFVVFFSISQIEIKPNASTATPCYQKAANKMKSKYFDIECGKIAGVVDCNEKLEYEEQANTFYSKGSGAPFSGMCETCHRNGVLERRIHFVNGKEDGKDTTYYATGCPMVIREHTLGLETGTWKFFYDSTQVLAWSRGYYRGVKQGVHVFFDNKGDTTVYEEYANNLLNGVKKVYFTKNRVERIVHYKNGVFDGTYVTYNLDGKKTSELNYKAGKKNGLLTYYYDDGTLLKTENWLNDVKNGEFKTFYYNGSLQTLETYKNGVKEGHFEEWYSNNKKKRIAEYKKGGILIEHKFDMEGNETYTYGAQPLSGNEDDKAPEVKKKSKK